MVFDMSDNESRMSLHAINDWNIQLHQYVSSRDLPVILAGNKVHYYGQECTINMVVYKKVCTTFANVHEQFMVPHKRIKQTIYVLS